MREHEAERAAPLPEYGAITISVGEHGEARYARLPSAASDLHARGGRSWAAAFADERRSKLRHGAEVGWRA